MPPIASKVRVAITALAVYGVSFELDSLLLRFTAWRALYDRLPFWAIEGPVSLLQIATCIVAVCVLHRLTLGAGLRELGWQRAKTRAGVATILSMAPATILFVVTLPLEDRLVTMPILYLAFLSPLAEEVVFRGWLFGRLYRRLEMAFWPAILAVGLVFGLSHVVGHWGRVDSSALMWMMAYTTVGGALFSWLMVRWGYSIWPGFLVHAFLNLLFNLFDISAGPGWVPVTRQVTTALSIIALTLAWTPCTSRETTEHASARRSALVD